MHEKPARAENHLPIDAASRDAVTAEALLKQDPMCFASTFCETNQGDLRRVFLAILLVLLRCNVMCDRSGSEKINECLRRPFNETTSHSKMV